MATIRVCNLMPVRSWTPRSCWAGPGLTSPSSFPVPWALSQAMLGEGCSPVVSSDLTIPRAHGQFCCPCLPFSNESRYRISCLSP